MTSPGRAMTGWHFLDEELRPKDQEAVLVAHGEGCSWAGYLLAGSWYAEDGDPIPSAYAWHPWPDAPPREESSRRASAIAQAQALAVPLLTGYGEVGLGPDITIAPTSPLGIVATVRLPKGTAFLAKVDAGGGASWNLGRVLVERFAEYDQDAGLYYLAADSAAPNPWEPETIDGFPVRQVDTGEPLPVEPA